MKRYLFSIVIAFVQVSFAQNYLDLSVPLPPEVSVFETIVLDDCTYIREVVDDADIYVYNECCRSRKDEPMYISGEKVPLEVSMTQEGRFSVKPNAEQAQQMLTIVDDAFTIEQAESLRGYYMFIALRVSSTTGELTDVYFHFVKTTPYENIPIEVFRSIERRMKNELHFEITDFGRSLTYSSLGWAHCPRGKVESLPEEETESDTGNDNGLQTDLGGVSTDRGTTIGTIGTGGVIVTPAMGGQLRP